MHCGRVRIEGLNWRALLMVMERSKILFLLGKWNFKKMGLFQIIKKENI